MEVTKILASTVAKLNSSVHTGGGDDDTAALLAVLDTAGDGHGVHLVMDGAARISTLRLHSNTTIECLNKDCGFFQTGGTSAILLTNAEPSRTEIKTRNITLLGGTYNQNCRQQAHHREAAPGQSLCGNWSLCIAFFGVSDLLVRDITIAEFRTFAFTMGCFRYVTIENVRFDMRYHMGGNQDGFHFWGPGQYLTVRNCGGSVSDDIMNIGPDECDCVSSITDVLVDGLFLDDAEQAVRLLSRGTGRLDRVTLRNVTGQYRSYGFYINPWFPEPDTPDDVPVTHGNFGNIFIENVDLKEHPHTYEYHKPVLFCVGGNIECLTLKNIRHHNGNDARTLFEFGLPSTKEILSYKVTPDSPAHGQRMQTVILDGLTVTEGPDEPAGRDYITVYDTVENLVLKNTLVLKEQPEPNGTLLCFKEIGCVENLICESLYAKGLARLCSDPGRIHSRMQPQTL